MRWNARVAAGVFAIAFFSLAGYGLTLPSPYSVIWTGIFFSIGGVLVVFAIARLRLGPESKARQALVDHPGMSPEERQQSKEERERELDSATSDR